MVFFLRVVQVFSLYLTLSLPYIKEDALYLQHIFGFCLVAYFNCRYKDLIPFWSLSESVFLSTNKALPELYTLVTPYL